MQRFIELQKARATLERATLEIQGKINTIMSEIHSINQIVVTGSKVHVEIFMNMMYGSYPFMLNPNLHHVVYQTPTMFVNFVTETSPIYVNNVNPLALPVAGIRILKCLPPNPKPLPEFEYPVIAVAWNGDNFHNGRRIPNTVALLEEVKKYVK